MNSILSLSCGNEMRGCRLRALFVYFCDRFSRKKVIVRVSFDGGFGQSLNIFIERESKALNFLERALEKGFWIFFKKVLFR